MISSSNIALDRGKICSLDKLDLIEVFPHKRYFGMAPNSRFNGKRKWCDTQHDSMPTLVWPLWSIANCFTHKFIYDIPSIFNCVNRSQD